VRHLVQKPWRTIHVPLGRREITLLASQGAEQAGISAQGGSAEAEESCRQSTNSDFAGLHSIELD